MARTSTENPYWLSYSDLMGALLLVFILMLVVTLIVNHAQVADQQARLDEQKVELDEKQHKLDELENVRIRIVNALEELKTALVAAGYEVELDRRGTIRLRSNILFNKGERELLPSGRLFLETFVPTYSEILLGEQFRPYIAQIVIEGHTDSSCATCKDLNSSYLYNLRLSQRRAFAVAEHVFGSEFPTFAHRETLKEVLTSNGRSFMDLVTEKGVENPTKSRRVEFHFLLEEEEGIRQKKRAILTQSDVPMSSISQ